MVVVGGSIPLVPTITRTAFSMPITLTLPDSSQRHYDAPVPIYKIAQDLSPSLAKCALAGKIKGRLVDTSFIVKKIQQFKLSQLRMKKAWKFYDTPAHTCLHMQSKNYFLKHKSPLAQLSKMVFIMIFLVKPLSPLNNSLRSKNECMR